MSEKSDASVLSKEIEQKIVWTSSRSAILTLLGATAFFFGAAISLTEYYETSQINKVLEEQLNKEQNLVRSLTRVMEDLEPFSGLELGHPQGAQIDTFLAEINYIEGNFSERITDLEALADRVIAFASMNGYDESAKRIEHALRSSKTSAEIADTVQGELTIMSDLPTLPQQGKTQQKISIHIETISQDDAIMGKVTGLTGADRNAYKVIVYVKTNQWYIHPYESGGVGTAWASIASDGSWRIETVKRHFPARALAALVVTKDSRPPTPTRNIEYIPNKALTIKNLQGTPDYGKL